MKLVRETRRMEVCEGIKKGDILELENTLSCDKQVVKIIDLNWQGMRVIKLQNGKEDFYTYEGLTNYEAKKMKLVYDTDKGSQAAQTENSSTKLDRLKVEALDNNIRKYNTDYLERLAKEVFGEDIKVRVLG